nr:MAG TPA: hypothetical protein [Bacteriophage sp.]
MPVVLRVPFTLLAVVAVPTVILDGLCHPGVLSVPLDTRSYPTAPPVVGAKIVNGAVSLEYTVCATLFTLCVI